MQALHESDKKLYIYMMKNAVMSPNEWMNNDRARKKGHQIMKEIGSDLGRVVAFSLGVSGDCSIECVPWVRISTAVEGDGHE